MLVLIGYSIVPLTFQRGSGACGKGPGRPGVQILALIWWTWVLEQIASPFGLQTHTRNSEAAFLPTLPYMLTSGPSAAPPPLHRPTATVKFRRGYGFKVICWVRGAEQTNIPGVWRGALWALLGSRGKDSSLGCQCCGAPGIGRTDPGAGVPAASARKSQGSDCSFSSWQMHRIYFYLSTLIQ